MITVDGSLDRYIEAANEVTAGLLSSDSKALNALRALHSFFAESLWKDTVDDRPTPLILSLNSFTLFLAGIRMALSGHAIAVFPLLRTALESACYGFLMAKDESLEPIWTNRHDSPDARRLCRQALQAAVPSVSKALDAIQPGSGNLIADAYESAIDFGAHPNPRSIFPHLKIGDENNDYIVRLVTLYSAEQFEAKRALLATVEYGLAIAIVAFRAKAKPTQELADQINKLIDMKAAYEAELRGS